MHCRADGKQIMRRTVSFFLALLCVTSLLLPDGAFAEQQVSPGSSEKTPYSVTWIAGAMKILGIKGADGNAVSEEKLTEFAGQIKSMLDVAKNLSDDTLTTLIRSALSQQGLSLQEDQLARLVSLFRSSDGKENEEQSLASKLQDLQQTVEKATDTVSKAARFFRTITRSLREAANWFSHLGELFH